MFTRLKVPFFLLVFAVSPAEAAPKLKVGFIGSFSGSAQIYGDSAKNGFELALEELGGDQIEVFYEDDQFIAAKTVSAFKKLVSSENVDLVVSIGSTPSNAIAPLANRRKIPLVAWASDRSVSQDRSFVVRSYPSGFAEGQRVAKEAQRRGFERVAVVTAQNDYAQSWVKGLLHSLPEAQVLYQSELSAEVSDFKPILLRAKKQGVGQFLICLNPGRIGLFAKQAREIGMAYPIGGCEYLHSRDEVESSGEALLGSWFATIAVNDQFHEKYTKKFGNDDVISAAANHYDLAHILHRIILQGDSPLEISQMVSLGEILGAVNSLRVEEKDGDRFFNIPLVIKEVTKVGFPIVQN